MTALALCLIATHWVAAFWVGPRLAPAASRPGMLARRGIIGLALRAALLAVACLPFGLTTLLRWLVGLALAQTVVAVVEAALSTRTRFQHQGALWLFLGAQLLQVALAATAGLALGGPSATVSSLVPAGVVPVWTKLWWILGTLAFVTRGGMVLVDRTLRQVPILTAAGDNLRTGRIIGVLERLLVFFLVVQGEWAAVGLVVAAKSIIRFKDLEQRNFAEYYLIGTLTSLLVAGLAGWVARLVVLRAP